MAAYLEGDDAFCMTYGDGLSDVDISASIDFHQQHGGQVTITAVQPPARFGALGMNGTTITSFQEKPQEKVDGSMAASSCCRRKALDEIHNDAWMFEREPMDNLTAQGQVHAFRHRGFWLAMDTLRDKQRLEELWAAGGRPGKYGENLARTSGFSDRSHWIQGRLARALAERLGAQVRGYALDPCTEPNLFKLASVENRR